MTRAILKIATMAALMFVAAACSGADDDGAEAMVPIVVDADETVGMLGERDDLQIIDVRTPAEFDEGHLAEAQLIDVQNPAFVEQVRDLDPDGPYLVYCRTGNRSAQAVSIMRDLGFTELYNAGGLADLAVAGATVAKG